MQAVNFPPELQAQVDRLTRIISGKLRRPCKLVLMKERGAVSIWAAAADEEVGPGWNPWAFSHWRPMNLAGARKAGQVLRELEACLPYIGFGVPSWGGHSHHW
jgi:hypothetical protein